MNFLSGQDDLFQTGNQPISARHLSQPYNNNTFSTFNVIKLSFENNISINETISTMDIFAASKQKEFVGQETLAEMCSRIGINLSRFTDLLKHVCKMSQ